MIWRGNPTFAAVSGLLMLASFSLILFLPIDEAYSQDRERAAESQSEICLMLAPRVERGAPIYVVAPASNARALVARKYREVPCAEAFPSSADRSEWRDTVCRLASDPRESFQREIEGVFGVRASALCAMAELTSEQWDGRGGRVQ